MKRAWRPPRRPLPLPLALPLPLPLLLLLVVAATPALADDKSEAEALFKKAKKLHGDKRYADACPMFEKSDALDSGIGAKLNVAKCYEDWGMLARAHRWYVDAERMARDASDKRASKIRELIDKLDPDVPRLTINAPDPANPKSLRLEVDGKPAALAKALRVDPGPHEITWRAAGGKPKSKTIAMERGGERELTLDLEAAAEPVATDGPTSKPAEVRVDGADNSSSPSPSTASPGRTRRIIGISLGVAGLAGIGVASYLTLDARASYNDALDAHCMGASNMCDDEGLAITRDARSQANTATIITVASLAAVVGGVVLYLTAPKASKESNRRSALYVSPVVGEHSGIVLGGGF